MKMLYLLRHAKSTWDQPVADRDRPLAPRGERAARRMAEHMQRHRIHPAVVLCSPATRARATLDLAAAGLGRAPPSAWARQGSDERPWWELTTTCMGPTPGTYSSSSGPPRPPSRR